MSNVWTTGARGIVHFRVVHMGSVWTGGHCFVHYLQSCHLSCITSEVFPQRIIKTIQAKGFRATPAPNNWLKLLLISQNNHFKLFKNAEVFGLTFLTLVLTIDGLWSRKCSTVAAISISLAPVNLVKDSLTNVMQFLAVVCLTTLHM